jgi:hypothetical protein
MNIAGIKKNDYPQATIFQGLFQNKLLPLFQYYYFPPRHISNTCAKNINYLV